MSINGSGTLTYVSGNIFSFNGAALIFTNPITINADVTVTFGSDLTLTTTSQYFIIGGDNVTIDGAGYEVDFSGINTSSGDYNGFIDGGSTTYSSTVENIGCINSGSSGIISYISRGNFGASSSISNCYVICGGGIRFAGIAGQDNSAPISNCYVICGGNIAGGGGIAGYNNQSTGTISNCYVICGGVINFQCGGIAGSSNSATISNCYVICGGDIGAGGGGGGGIAGINNSAPISNCYVICGGNIDGNCGGIAGQDNSANISDCYVICGGNIGSNCGGIAGANNSATISNCYVSCSNADPSNYVGSGTEPTNCAFDLDAKWTSAGYAKLDNTSNVWTDITNGTDLRPWVLSAFDTAIASSTTATSSYGSISLNTYGQSFANGTVYTGTNGATFTYNAGSNIAYSSISSGTYTLGLYANDLLSNLTSFTLTNGTTTMRTAFNYNGSNAEEVIPYSYSVTDDVTLTYAAISNICFQEKTPIKTDQGIIQIEKLNPDVNTIKNKKIVGITKTISQDKYLVCFEKDSLGLNYPTKSTTVTKQHKILYRGKMIEAEKFLGHFVGVKKAKYNGGVLYNVLMEKHEVVSANNLVCETLHPQNIIAKLYTSFMSESYKSILTSLINESILKNDHTAYKKIVNRL